MKNTCSEWWATARSQLSQLPKIQCLTGLQVGVINDCPLVKRPHDFSSSWLGSEVISCYSYIASIIGDIDKNCHEWIVSHLSQFLEKNSSLMSV